MAQPQKQTIAPAINIPVNKPEGTNHGDAFLNYFANKSKDDGEPISEPTIFVDQIPKFDMVFQGLNEVEGIVSQAILRGVTLTNFGTTFSIDDIYTESTFTYVAEEYFPLSIEKDRSHALRRAGKQSTQDIITDASALLQGQQAPSTPTTKL